MSGGMFKCRTCGQMMVKLLPQDELVCCHCYSPSNILCWGCNKPIDGLCDSHVFGYPKFIAVYHEACCPGELHNLPCLDRQEADEQDG